MLSDTYDAYSDLAGKEVNGQPVLLPIYHSTVNAQIELALDENGNLIHGLSRVIGKEEDGKVTIIPVTEDSASRGNGNIPHPLVDKLCYLAGDYSLYTKDEKTEYYLKYMEGLKDWVESPYTHKAIQAIYQYLKKGCLIKDLLSMQILQLDENGILSDNVNKLQGQNQTGAVVRFCVGMGPGKYIWKSKELYQLYINFSKAKKKEKEICYVTGNQTVCSDKHPAKVRNSGDKAKLISGNDESGFTYRGRFLSKEQAVRVGYETSQKAHNALRWLLQKQGYKRDDAAIVAWEVHGKPIPGLICDTIHAVLSIEDDEIGCDDDEIGYEESEVNYSTGEYYAKKLKNAMNGYAIQFTESDQVVLIALDSATTGRMSITYYHEMAGNQFIRRVQQWHEHCAWVRYVAVTKGKRAWVECAPSPREIALAAYGVEHNRNGYLDADKKLLRSTVERILPCIVNENRKIPMDIMRAVVNRASTPEAFTSFLWENQVMRVACAIIKYNCFGGEKMKLDDEKVLHDRNFLFGRLLAVLDEMEVKAMFGEKDKERLTNAKSYWNAYSKRPARTYATIKGKVMPYLKKLNNSKIAYYENITQEILSLMVTEDFNDKPLNELYLPGYYCQREEIRRHRGKNESENEGGNENE